MTTFTRQCIAEAIGTFCIVFAGTGAIESLNVAATVNICQYELARE